MNIKKDNAKFFSDIQNSASQLYKYSIFDEEYIVIPMITIPNDEVVVPFQNENIVVPLQSMNIVHPEVDPADEVELENSQP